jgi:hypothetical protein
MLRLKASSFAASAMFSALSLGCSAKGRITAFPMQRYAPGGLARHLPLLPLLHSNRGQTSSRTSSAI